MAASHVANYQYYVSGQLKTNVQSRLDYLSDVFLNLSELVQKYDSENRQMKEFIAVLLHFKYMLQFLKTNLIRDDDLFKKLGPDAAILFKTDLKQCMSKFNQVVASSACFDFVNDKNDYYRNNGTYCSYNEDDIAPVMPKKSRFSVGSVDAFSVSKSTNHSNASISQANAEFSSDRGDMTSNASDSEHLEIKLEPDVEIIEPMHQNVSIRLDSTNESDDSRPADARSSNSNNNNNSNTLLTAMLDKPINAPSSQPSTSSSHKSTRDRNNDLKLTIVTTPQSSRKVVKRSIQSYQEGADETPSNNQSSSNNNNSISSNSKAECSTSTSNNGTSTSFQKKHRSAKANVNYNFERDNSREEDYDFDYEKEDYDFDEEDFANFNSTGQARCPQSGCGLIFDSEVELTEHLKNAHFTMVDFNTYECLVEGCNEKFPNL